MGWQRLRGGQDTREVKEPVIPPACIKLEAKIVTAPGETLKEADEASPDSTRIQEAIGSETNTGDSFLLVDGLTEDHTTSGIRIKSNVTRGGLVHDMVYRNICMRDVQVPIAISPYYNDGTTDQFFDPGFTGTRIPDYKNIKIEHVLDMTPGDVLIAGYDEAHRTQVALTDVTIKGITLDKMHLKFADITDDGTNLPLAKAAEGNNVVITTVPGGKTSYSCEGKFVPMR